MVIIKLTTKAHKALYT